ncbi:DNA cytosine methyltransferase [Zavarzinella formosa]|uniref:DNA cytosine methyltransferase n=1 Tax=Zavarzinella formosa TaxID=360055 RepID=UPI00030BBA84|nr:DNA cytosine methyltransferase [Zavarzinella formosa]
MLEVIDLFCGAGGMSCGLRSAGLRIRAGVDFNKLSVETYRRNFPRARGVCADVKDVRAADLAALLDRRRPFVLAGCPPCQLFSQLHRASRPVGEEFGHYLRLLWALRPDYLVFENVPRIVSYKKAWERLLNRLRQLGYHVTFKVVSSETLGVPQKRKRLVLVAAKSEIILSDPDVRSIKTVRDAIEGLPESDFSIPNHVTMKLSPANLARIQATMKNGGRSKMPRSAFDDSYGRMRWDAPAPTITTRCISFSNGCFGHPEYDRAITVREAALLQGFDRDFRFVGGVWETAKQVGNAVPPPIAQWLGENILRHFRAS